MVRKSFCAVAVALAFAAAPVPAGAAPANAEFIDLSTHSPAPLASAPLQTTPKFVDLTGQRHAPSNPLPPPAPQFDDLSDQNSSAVVSPAVPDHSPRMHYYDLTTGRMVESTPPGLAKPTPPLNVYADDEAADPWEGFNRSHFGGHVFLETDVIDPIEDVYIGVTPRFLRAAVHNFITNLDAPKIFANDVLQVDLRRAGGTAARFIVNSSIGIGGILDLATPIGIPFHDNDFGQTLATYGADDAPYLLVPIVGPSNPRDLAGKVVDIFLDPLEYITVPGGIFTSIGHAAVNQLDARSEHVGRLNGLVETTRDPYAVERHDSRARRQAEVGSGGFEDGD
jgi:phospholipid-binding lipoprotein MlaA